MKETINKILNAIPEKYIREYLNEKDASKKQLSSSGVGSAAARRKAKNEWISELTAKMAK